MFGSRSKAINIDAMYVYPSAPDVDSEYTILADFEITPNEEPDDSTTMDFEVTGSTNQSSQLDSAGRITTAIKPSYRTFFRFNTSDSVGTQAKAFKAFPVFNNLVIAWTVDNDFVIEIEFTVLDTNWDFRAELMRLLQNKFQVRDPNIDNVQGKRSLLRAPLLS